MPIYKISELNPFLNSLGTSAKKGLSQNFLVDGNIVKKIITLSETKPDIPILEIGPGPGAMTEELLSQGHSVTAVEIDQTFANALSRFKGDLKVYAEDFLKFDLDLIHTKSKVIANLPYHVTTPILAKLLPRRDLFSTLTVMVQDEVARRITAAPNTADYGSLSLFINYYAKAHYGFKVSRRSFWPKPTIDSAVVHLTLQEPPFVKSEEQFFKMTRQAFQQRRKMLRTSLQTLYEKEKIIEALIANNLKETARPEELSLQQFIDLYQRLAP